MTAATQKNATAVIASGSSSEERDRIHLERLGKKPILKVNLNRHHIAKG
jgi:hypothetical protein